MTRIVVYDFLRRVFLNEPTGDFFGRLEESGLFEELRGLPGVEKMSSAIEAAPEPDRVEEIRQDFYQLFLGPRHLKAPPWASVYISGSRPVNREARAKVRQSYLEFGFQTEAGQLEDHFGTECDFLFRLCGLSVNAGETESRQLLRAQKHFVSEHLRHWVPSFAEDIRKNALTNYFQGLGEFMKHWIRSEHEYLSRST